jgi:hypothetical protein
MNNLTKKKPNYEIRKQVIDFEFDFPLVHGETLQEVPLKAEFHWVNEGIGRYECWGAIYTDNHYQWELHNIEYAGNDTTHDYNALIDEHYEEICTKAENLL